MKLAIFTDIWGIDPTLASWANSLPCADQLELLSPYPQGCDTELPHFSDDQHAYSFFTQHGGLDQYTTFARDWMAQQTDPVMQGESMSVHFLNDTFPSPASNTVSK